MKVWIAAAMFAAWSGSAQAQRGNEPAVVEVIGTGSVEIRASGQRFSVIFTGKGSTTAAAEAARARKEADVLRLLAVEGVPPNGIAPLSSSELSRATLLQTFDLGVDGEAAPATEPQEEARGGRTVEVPSLAQATALAAKLKAIGVDVGTPTAVYSNVASARRDARLAALGDARAAADRYATALRMRLGPVRRVSETGAAALLPGFQEKIGNLVATGGPGLMQQMLQPPKDSIKVEEAIVVEYTLLP